MAIIKSIRGKTPILGKECWLAENATVVGEVELGNGCTVWFGAVVRGDVNFIKVGNNTNIQDNVTIHGTYEKHGTTIGSNVTIGHNAVVHGCTIEDNTLIGMGVVVLDGAIVKPGSVVGAGSVVLAGTVIEEDCVYGGIPAKKIKAINAQNREMLARISSNYKTYASWFKEENLNI